MDNFSINNLDSDPELVYPDLEPVTRLGRFHYHTPADDPPCGDTVAPSLNAVLSNNTPGGSAPAIADSNNAAPAVAVPVNINRLQPNHLQRDHLQRHYSRDYRQPNHRHQATIFDSIRSLSSPPTITFSSSPPIDPQILIAYEQLSQQSHQPRPSQSSEQPVPGALEHVEHPTQPIYQPPPQSPTPPPPPPPHPELPPSPSIFLPADIPSPAENSMAPAESPYVATNGNRAVYYCEADGCEADGCEAGLGGTGFEDYEAYKKHVAENRDLNNHRAAYHYCPLPHPALGEGTPCPKFISVLKRLDEIHRHFKKDHGMSQPSQTAARKRHRDRMVEVAKEACRAEGHAYVPYRKRRD